MRKLGTKTLTVHLDQPLSSIPDILRGWDVALGEGGAILIIASMRGEPSAAFLR